MRLHDIGGKCIFNMKRLAHVHFQLLYGGYLNLLQQN
jgi:hypothetical protein